LYWELSGELDRNLYWELHRELHRELKIPIRTEFREYNTVC
jgi:hypothetical protein